MHAFLVCLPIWKCCLFSEKLNNLNRPRCLSFLEGDEGNALRFVCYIPQRYSSQFKTGLGQISQCVGSPKVHCHVAAAWVLDGRMSCSSPDFWWIHSFVSKGCEACEAIANALWKLVLDLEVRALLTCWMTRTSHNRRCFCSCLHNLGNIRVSQDYELPMVSLKFLWTVSLNRLADWMRTRIKFSPAFGSFGMVWLEIECIRTNHRSKFTVTFINLYRPAQFFLCSTCACRSVGNKMLAKL